MISPTPKQPILIRPAFRGMGQPEALSFVPGASAIYLFDEDSASPYLYDRSGNGNHGLKGNSVTPNTNWPTKVQQGYYFTTDDKVVVGTKHNGGAISVSVVAKLLDPGGGATNPMMGEWYYLNAGDRQGWRVDLNGSGFGRFSFYNGSTTVTAIDSNDLRGAGWKYITGVFTPGVSAELFINGISAQKTTTTSTTYVINTHDGLVFGYLYTNENIYLKGSLAYADIYSRALTFAEISQNYNYLKSYLAPRGVVLA